jgi:hypothetical protein
MLRTQTERVGRLADRVIQRTGYCDLALRLKKLECDQRLVKLELAEQSDHPFTLFNLGSILQEQRRAGAESDGACS